jgi:hypothetical protein
MNIVKSFLIWSNEHQAWWGPKECGYVKARRIAGRYSLERAIEICLDASKADADLSRPNEMIVPIAPVPEP